MYHILKKSHAARFAPAAAVLLFTAGPALGQAFVADSRDNPSLGVVFVGDDNLVSDAGVTPVLGHVGEPVAAEPTYSPADLGESYGFSGDATTAPWTSCDDCGTCDLGCEPCPPCGPRWFGYGEFLYLRPTGGDVAHAQQQNGTGPPGSGAAGTTPFGRIATVSHDFEPAVRVGGGCYLDECSSFRFSYTFFEAADDDFVTVNSGGALGSLVQHPGASITASTGPAAAAQSIDFEIADFVFHDRLRDLGWCQLNYSLGGQYGQLEQQFAQDGIFVAGTAGGIDTTTDIEFNGGGLKGGLDMLRCLGRGVNFYAKSSAAVMSGRFNARYYSLNSTTATDLAIAEWEDNRIVPQLEIEVGLKLNTSDERFWLSAGYVSQHWFNTVTTAEFIDAVQADNYTDVSDTLSFDGLTARFEARF